MARTVREVDLGTAPAGTTLKFNVTGTGFSANAMLDCGMKLVATWESVEIVNTTIDEQLVPPGNYTLQIAVAFRSKTPVPFSATFTTTNEGEVIVTQARKLIGKINDVARFIVFLTIV